MKLWAIVLAGGRGERLRREVNKVYLPIAGRELLEFCLDTLSRSDLVQGLVIVARPDDAPQLEEAVEVASARKPTEVVAGGTTRHRSEQHGIEALASRIEAGEVEWVAIHDGARPFLTLELLESVVGKAQERGGAVPALPVSGPLYERRSGGVVPLDTDSVRRVQTPQVFAARSLLEGYRRAEADGFEGVDTAETIERYTDLEVGIVPGDPRNIKVTFVEDLLVAEDLARMFEEGRWVEAEERW